MKYEAGHDKFKQIAEYRFYFFQSEIRSKRKKERKY